MGIKKLSWLIEKLAPSATKRRKLKEYYGYFVGLDASNVIYRHVIGVRKKGMDLTDKKGNLTSHIHGIFNKTLSLLKFGIKPQFTFDGEPPKIKLKEIEKRNKRKEKYEEKMEELESDDEEYKKLFGRTFKLKDKHIKQVKLMLKLMGLPYVQAPSEADPQCAYMAKKKKIDAVVSEDMDMLTFGTPILLKDFSTKQKKGVKEIHLKKVLEELELDMEEFVDLSILMGSDYDVPKIAGIGPIKAYEIISKYGSIKKFLKAVEKKKIKYNIPKDFEKKYKKVKEYFLNPPVEKNVNVEWKKPDIKKLYKLLIYFGFNKTKSKEKVLELYRYWKKLNKIKKKATHEYDASIMNKLIKKT